MKSFVSTGVSVWFALCVPLAKAFINDDQVGSITSPENFKFAPKPENDPRFKPVESHFLTLPAGKDDFERWQAYENAVFLNSKIMLAPETYGSFGYLESKIENPIKETWVARIDFRIAREKFKRKDWTNGDGMGIYYLRTVNPEAPVTPNYYGYHDNFDGIGVFISPNKSQKADGPIRRVQIQARSPSIKYERIQEVDKKKRSEKEFHQCFMPVVNNPEGWSRISIEYERPNLKVFVFDHTTQEFQHCFSMEVILDYNGYFVISASGGDFNPYFS